MIVIKKADDIIKIKEQAIIPYIENLVSNIIKAYSSSSSFEAVGAIYFLESKYDFSRFKEMGLSSPLCEERFEWIDKIGNGYSDGCIVINNDFAINIIGKTEFFKKEFQKDEHFQHS